MKHISVAEWHAYLADEIPEAQKIDYENHLYSCDECLEVYMEALEREENVFPSEKLSIADSVMGSIARLKEEPLLVDKSNRKNKSIRTITKHYVIAAGFTILLMASGVFQSLTEYVSNVESGAVKEKPTVTDGLIDKTFNWMDEIEKKNKEGFENE